MSERDLAAEIDALAKRIDQHDTNIETAANDHAELRELVMAINHGVDAVLINAHSDYSKLAKRIEAIEGEAKRLNAVILDDVLHTLGDMKEVEAVERTSEPPRLDDAFPIPAPVEQGPTSEGIDDDDLAREFHEAYEQLAPRFGYETRKASAKPWSEVPDNNRCLMRAVMSSVMQPKLAAKDAEIVKLKADNVRLKDDYKVAVNNIGYRSQELKEARAEIERLSTGWSCGWCDEEFEQDDEAASTAHAFVCKQSPVVKQLATARQELNEARSEVQGYESALALEVLGRQEIQRQVSDLTAKLAARSTPTTAKGE